jgi:hypothetical protein
MTKTYVTVLTTLLDRIFPIREEIERRQYPADLDERILTIRHDLERALERCAELTDERRSRLSNVSTEHHAGRVALAEGKANDAQAAFQRAYGWINGVAVEITTRGPDA